MTARTALVLILSAQVVGAGLSQAQSLSVIGIWRTEIAFSNGESRSLRFEARASGKGSFVALVPKPNQAEPTEPLAANAEWTRSPENSLTFSGPVQFPLGNVGLERGTLILKGKFESDGSITGEAEFFSIDQDPLKAKPSKSGTFKAIRVTG